MNTFDYIYHLTPNVCVLHWPALFKLFQIPRKRARHSDMLYSAEQHKVIAVEIYLYL